MIYGLIDKVLIHTIANQTQNKKAMGKSINRFIVSAMTTAVMLMAAGCGGGKEKKAEVTGPAETVEAFCRAVAAGEFEKAKELCDTVAMKGYIDTYAEEMETMARRDSGAVAIAAATLAAGRFTVDDMTRDGDSRQIFYTIDAGDGMSKKKTATVRKTEGVWKVEEITDRP